MVSGSHWVKHIFLFPVVFVYFEILLRLFGETKLFSHSIYILLFGIAGGLFCSCITSVFPRRVNRVLSMVILYGTGLLFIVECLVKDSFTVYMSLKSVMTGAGGVMGGFTSELFSSIFHGIPVILLFFLPGIAYTAAGRKFLPARRQKISFVLMILVCALFFRGIGALTASVGSSKGKYKTQFEFDTATKWFGLLTSVRLDRKYGGDAAAETMKFQQVSDEKDSKKNGGKDKAEEKEYGKNMVEIDFDSLIAGTSDETLANMHSYVKSLEPSAKNEYTGLFKGKNLILICAEALSDIVVDKELTPTLYRMVHSGFYFSEYYQPTWGGSTSTGEYSFLTGLAPLNGVNTILDVKNNNEYYTLGNQLMRQGYFSRCYHNGRFDYYSRNQTHTNLGYEQFLALGNGLEEITGDWPRDTVTFDKTMDTYMTEQPFSIYYMTISGHCTYKSTDWRVKENLDKVTARYGSRFKSTTNNYLCYQLELENALTLMIEKLEAAGIADDTVICMTSDHYPYGLEKTSTFGNSEDYVTDLYGYEYTNAWEKDHNTWVIWSGCLENEKKDMVREIKEPTYSLDIVPTLSNLFGLEFDSRLLVGRDVFSDAEPIVLWNNRSWATTKGKYDAAEDSFIPNEGETADEAYIERMKTIVSNKLTYSSQVVDKNYYEVLFGNTGGSLE